MFEYDAVGPDEPLDFADMNNSGFCGEDDWDHIREMDYLQDARVAAEVAAERRERALAVASPGGTSGHEAEHRPDERRAAGAATWEGAQEQEEAGP